jgi:hypothetical protein
MCKKTVFRQGDYGTNKGGLAKSLLLHISCCGYPVACPQASARKAAFRTSAVLFAMYLADQALEVCNFLHVCKGDFLPLFFLEVRKNRVIGLQSSVYIQG